MSRPFSTLFTAAVAVLALLGTAQPATAQTTQPKQTAPAQLTDEQEPLLSEVLIDTLQGTRLIDAVEIVNPDRVSLDGYQIRHCDVTGTWSTLLILDESDWTRVAADNTFGDWHYTFYDELDPQGGLALINTSGNMVDAVTFNPGNSVVTDCLTGDQPGTPDASLSPTTTQSAQRTCDTGPWVLAPPTLGRPNCIGI